MKIGEKVICINGAKKAGLNYDHFQEFPIEGHKYTIRRGEENPLTGFRILLKEITNKPIYTEWLFGKVEPAFSKDRFMLLSDYQDYLRYVNESTDDQDYIIFK